MQDFQHEKLFTELSPEIEALAFKELDDEVAATCSGGVAYTGSNDPDVILFDGKGFTGDSLRVNASTGDGLSDLRIAYKNQNKAFDNKTSSISIIKGRWGFYQNAGYNTKVLRTLGPGQYRNVDPYNNSISSLFRIAAS